MCKKEHLQRVLLPVTLPGNQEMYNVTLPLVLGICSICADNDLLHVKFLCYKHARAERILGLLAQFPPSMALIEIDLSLVFHNNWLGK
jgi:hypothetical protein